MKTKYQKNDDQILFESVNNFFDEKRAEFIQSENDLVPFSQSYKNAFITFGYKKSEI